MIKNKDIKYFTLLSALRCRVTPSPYITALRGVNEKILNVYFCLLNCLGVIAVKEMELYIFVYNTFSVKKLLKIM